MGKYHRENAQEGFLVVAGECMLIVEEQERRLATWGLLSLSGRHRPHHRRSRVPGPAIVVAVGARGRGIGGGVVYVVSELAARYGASVERETTGSAEAYAEIFGAAPIQVRPVPAGIAARPRLTATRWILPRDGLSVGDTLAGTAGSARRSTVKSAGAEVGDILFKVGDRRYPLIAIIEGEAAILDASGAEIIRHGPSGFLGESNLLSGQTV